MNIAILGSGNIGKNVARHLLREGHHEVSLANSRGPGSLAALVSELGPHAHAATVADAVHGAELLLLAVPWTAREQTVAAAGGSGAFTAKIVIDAMNPYLEYPAVEDLHGRGASEVVAALLPGARLVKAFNTINYESLANGAKPGASETERIALPLCGDDAQAKVAVAALIGPMGFTPVDLGGLARGHFQEPRGPFYDKNYTAAQVRSELARLDGGR